MYQPTRAYHISEELTKVKNIYAKEEKSTSEIKGNVKVHYQLVDGTSIKESVDVVKDAVVSSTEEKYYLDKNDKKVVVGTPTTANNDVSYDTTTRKLQEITKDGKKYKLVGLKTGSPSETGKVASGTTEITYVYKLATAGNIFEKYMIEGTNTEIAMEKQLTKEPSIGDAYTSTPPKVYTIIKKDGKTYIYKGHRSTSAPENGKVEEGTKTIIYDFVELISEKGEPIKQDNLPEGVVSEKGNPEIREELPEAVISKKGESILHEISKLIITRHIIEEKNIDLIPPREGNYPAEQGIIKFQEKEYVYDYTEENDGIITHYYKAIVNSKIVEKFTESKIESTKKPDRNLQKEYKLPNTGASSKETITLGLIGLIAAEIIRRKQKE